MADRVHPTESPRSSTSNPTSPTPGTYVIQIPKDQVFRVPPPENSRRFNRYTRQSNRRCRFCRCLCYLLVLFIILIVLLGIAAAIFYLIVRPKSPHYSIDAIAIRGINSTSSISPQIDVTVRADNPNKKIGIYYEPESSIQVFFSDVKLADGEFPVFFQPSKNVTVFRSLLRGSAINVSSLERKAMVDEEKKRKVALKAEIRVPIKVKVGVVKTWKIKVKVSCDVTVDELTEAAKIVSNACDYSVKPW